MTDITPCPACGKRNRVPSAATGRPTCAVCGAALPWIADATDATFDDSIATAVPVLVDLWAPWCGPCQMVTPILADLAIERAGRLKVVKVNVDQSPEIAARYRVQGIPTLLLFHNGRLTDRQTGALAAHALTQWLDTHTPGAA